MALLRGCREDEGKRDGQQIYVDLINVTRGIKAFMWIHTEESKTTQESFTRILEYEILKL